MFLQNIMFQLEIWQDGKNRNWKKKKDKIHWTKSWKKILKYYENYKITSKEFREKAKKLCSDSSFKESIGWLMRIKKKFKLDFGKNNNWILSTFFF